MKAEQKKHFILGLSAIIMISTGCAQSNIKSLWRDREIAIDGDQAEWSSDLVVPESSEFSLGVINDESNLYLTFGTYDQSLAFKVLKFGFTVWIDPQGKKKKAFGIKYPLGSPVATRDRSRGNNRSRSNERDLTAQLREMSGSQLWVDVLGSNGLVVERIVRHPI